jgi:hypothetical protein
MSLSRISAAEERTRAICPHDELLAADCKLIIPKEAFS